MKHPQLYDREAMLRREPLMLCQGAIIPFDKPLDWSSFDLVKYLRIAVNRKFGIRRLKTGHAGTLDPRATGLLQLCTGRATKSIELLMDHDKEYEATIKLGATTPSFDTEHEEDKLFEWEHITEEMVKNVLPLFEGEIMQVPPLFSAISIDGKRAYKLARKGRDVELPAKPVMINSIELITYALPYINIKVHCGRGTYIRSLARDIGESLSSGGYLTALRRTRVGAISVEQAFQKEDIDQLLALACLDVEE